MSEAALQQIQSGLAGAQAALLQGELEAMHGHLVRTLDALADVTRAGLVAKQERPAVPWDEARAAQLVWELLARLKAAGCAPGRRSARLAPGAAAPSNAS